MTAIASTIRRRTTTTSRWKRLLPNWSRIEPCSDTLVINGKTYIPKRCYRDGKRLVAEVESYGLECVLQHGEHGENSIYVHRGSGMDPGFDPAGLSRPADAPHEHLLRIGLCRCTGRRGLVVTCYRDMEGKSGSRVWSCDVEAERSYPGKSSSRSMGLALTDGSGLGPGGASRKSALALSELGRFGVPTPEADRPRVERRHGGHSLREGAGASMDSDHKAEGRGSTGEAAHDRHLGSR